MKNNKDISIKEILKRVAIGFVIGVIFSLFTSDPISWILGITFGLTLSLLNFRLLYLTLTKAVWMSSGKAQSYTISRYMIRYFIMGIALLVSLKAPYINMIGTIVGLLLLKIVILLSNLLNSMGLLKETFIRSK